MLHAVLNKSLKQHFIKEQLYGYLPPISQTIKVRRTRHAGEVEVNSQWLIGINSESGRLWTGMVLICPLAAHLWHCQRSLRLYPESEKYKYIYMYIQSYIYIHTHTHTHIYIYIWLVVGLGFMAYQPLWVIQRQIHFLCK